MRMLDFTEAQRSRQRVNCGDRRTDGPPLFQPDVPIDPDPGQFGDFLAPQAGSATSSPVGKTNRFGVKLPNSLRLGSGMASFPECRY